MEFKLLDEKGININVYESEIYLVEFKLGLPHDGHTPDRGSEIYLVEFKPVLPLTTARKVYSPKSTLWNLNISQYNNLTYVRWSPKSTLWNLNDASRSSVFRGDRSSEIYLVEFKPGEPKPEAVSPDHGPKSTLWNLNALMIGFSLGSS